ncbi:hypothetical protein M758_12G171900 [Ceratodon purpureus]|nr:hypothetical protein M758_12G171900 [Ceratodon purpureus]
MDSSPPFKFRMEWKSKSGGGKSGGSGGRSGGGGGSSKRKREDIPKKHRSSEFSRGSSRGIVTKLDSRDVRSIASDPDVVVRPLGERVDIFSSQQSVYLESAVEEDVIDGLQSKISELQALVASTSNTVKMLNQSIVDERRRVDSALDDERKRINISHLFLHQGMCNALRAFSDLILEAFYMACGKEIAGYEERAAWLFDSGKDGAEAYVSGHGVTISLFGGEKRIGRTEFHLIKALRKASSMVSSHVSHSATPIEVAVALQKEGLNVFASDLKHISGLFRLFFDMSAKEMVKDWEEGHLKEEFQTKFHPGRPPRAYTHT